MRLLFAVTALLGAFLLFLVEPMFARMVLPLLGGAPAVWNSCLVFYQVALLAGYLYAHAVGKRPLKQQVALQAVLLAAAAVVLPIAVRGSAPSANPIGWVFSILIVSLGLPFVVLATTGPLLQRWFSSLGPWASARVYSLFAASNVGSCPRLCRTAADRPPPHRVAVPGGRLASAWWDSARRRWLRTRSRARAGRSSRSIPWSNGSPATRSSSPT